MLSESFVMPNGEIPNTFANRAVWARAAFIENPDASQVDENGLVWMPYSDGYWYSIAGNYSGYSPEYKQQVKNINDREREQNVETAEEIYRQVMYQSHIRQSVLERDENTCQVCGKTATSKLHIHHILKRCEGGTDHLDNLITVCSSCHPKADRKLYNPDWVYVK